MDKRDILTIKGLIRRGEARTACTYNNIPLERCHFLDLPFYETGKIQKNPISEADVEIVRNLLREVKPHQIFVAGDLADPHGTHRVCTDAVFAAVDLEKEEGAEWLKDCRIVAHGQNGKLRTSKWLYLSVLKNYVQNVTLS